MATKTPKLADMGVADLTQQFEYDQLNRITASTALGMGNAYRTGYSYDANGNILALQRQNGGGAAFDNFTYHYETKAKGYSGNTNKLRYVDDSAPAAAHSDDLEDQGIDNYQYDDIGNLTKDEQEEIERIEWTVYGKVKSVTRTASSNKPNLEFEYDASGNRISKKITPKTGNSTTTYYLRDATGNVMSTYEATGNSSLTLTDQYLYGSSRLGVLKNGARSYELTDHLGNVRAVVDEFAEVRAAYEYYAFGMNLAKYEGSEGYRYGFNGKERETFFTSDNYDFGARIYDSRSSKFLILDPLADHYPFMSPYCFAASSPLRFIDENGEGPGDALLGWAIGVVTNLVPGSFLVSESLREAHAKLANVDPDDYNKALEDADNLFLGFGLMTAAVGSDITTGGVAMTTTGVLAPEGVPTTGVGLVITGVGLSTTSNATYNKSKGYEYNKNSTSSKSAATVQNPQVQKIVQEGIVPQEEQNNNQKHKQPKATQTVPKPRIMPLRRVRHFGLQRAN